MVCATGAKARNKKQETKTKEGISTGRKLRNTTTVVLKIFSWQGNKRNRLSKSVGGRSKVRMDRRKRVSRLFVELSAGRRRTLLTRKW